MVIVLVELVGADDVSLRPTVDLVLDAVGRADR
jgi:hypothetical protein